MLPSNKSPHVLRAYSIHCTVYSVQYTFYSVHCTLYSLHCTVYTVHPLELGIQKVTIIEIGPSERRPSLIAVS